jgi:transcriptional regulator with XRE-family HTH domain
LNPRPRAYESLNQLQLLNNLSVTGISELNKLSKAYISQVKHGNRPPSKRLLKTLASYNRCIGPATITLLSFLSHGKRWKYPQELSNSIALYGVTEAAVEIAQRDLSSIIVGTDNAISRLIKRLGEGGLNYELIDLCLKNSLV